MPRCGPDKKLQFEKQTKTPDPFRLLLFEVLHRGEIFKNEEFRKKSITYSEVFFTDIKSQSLGGNDLRRTVSRICFMEPGSRYDG